MKAVYPVGAPVVHFSPDDKPLDPAIKRPTHAVQETMVKYNGTEIPKNFLFPGSTFPFVAGVLFSELSDIQFMQGKSAGWFNEATRHIHSFDNYAQARLPEELIKHFYHHRIVVGELIDIEMIEPHD